MSMAPYLHNTKSCTGGAIKYLTPGRGTLLLFQNKAFIHVFFNFGFDRKIWVLLKNGPSQCVFTRVATENYEAKSNRMWVFYKPLSHLCLHWEILCEAIYRLCHTFSNSVVCTAHLHSLHLGFPDLTSKCDACSKSPPITDKGEHYFKREGAVGL